MQKRSRQMDSTNIPTGMETSGSDVSDPTEGESTVNSPKRTKRIGSPNQRRAEIVIAALFLVTAAASIPGAFVLDSILNASDYLARVFPHKGTVELGSLMWSINNIGIVFIAVFAFGVLRKLDEALAVGYLACRIIEGTIMMVGVVLKQAKFLGLTGLSLPMLGLGGLLFTWMLFRFRLVPRVISVVGLIGYAVVLCGSIAGWFGLIDVTPGSNGTIFALPVATFEIILLPFWLLFRGFKTPEASERIVATK